MSRYDLFRRRLAPVALILGIGLIARDSCERNQRTHTTLALSFGAAARSVRAVSVEVVIGGEIAAAFRRNALPGATIGPCRFAMSLPQDDGELRIDVDLDGSHRQVTRRFHAVEGATMLVSALDDGDSPPR